MLRGSSGPTVHPEFGGGKIMVGGYIQYGGAREICKVDSNIDTLIVPNINRFLPPSTFPTTGGVRFFNRI